MLTHVLSVVSILSFNGNADIIQKLEGAFLAFGLVIIGLLLILVITCGR